MENLRSTFPLDHAAITRQALGRVLTDPITWVPLVPAVAAYTIFDVPISVTNSISPNSARPSCDSMLNPMLAPEEVDVLGANNLPVMFAPGDATVISAFPTPGLTSMLYKPAPGKLGSMKMNGSADALADVATTLSPVAA